MHRYWILDGRTQTYFEIPMRSVQQYVIVDHMLYASRRFAVGWYSLLNAVISRQHYDEKILMLAVLSILFKKCLLYAK